MKGNGTLRLIKRKALEFNIRKAFRTMRVNGYRINSMAMVDRSLIIVALSTKEIFTRARNRALEGK